MVKPYYCDYCDRRFKDEKSTREKHLASIQHKKNKAEYYAAHRDPDTFLKEESAKKPCRMWFYSGYCAFGVSCLYTHYTMQELEDYKQRVEEKRKSKIVYPDQTFIEQHLSDYMNMEVNDEDEIDLSPWDLPPELQAVKDLPPSLMPLDPKSFINCKFPKWGDK